MATQTQTEQLSTRFGDPDSSGRSRRHFLSVLAFRNASAIYVFALIFLIFSLWVPDTFLLQSTWKSLLDEQALTVLVSVGLVVPLAAGVFDLAIGAEVGFAVIVVAWLIQTHGLGVAAAIPLTLIAGAMVGVGSGLLITRARIDSFIATLGISSILLALTRWTSGGFQIIGLPQSFQHLATGRLFGVTYAVYYAAVVAVVIWYFLERTPAGRRVYAVGGNPVAARLSGIHTSRVVVASLVVSGCVAALAGVLLSARLAVGDPTVGPSYLLPAFTGAFLGSTQFRGGRFNVWGTVVAVYMLAAGVKGLQLAGAPIWIPDLFNGVALLIAVGMAKFERRSDPRFASIRTYVSRVRRPGVGSHE